MKKIITIILAVLMTLTLTACGSSEGEGKSQEDKKNHIGETEFLNPDEVTTEKSQNSEKADGTEDDKYDYKIVFTYEDLGSAVIASEEYRNYLEGEFPKRKDSNGFIISVSDPVMNESSTMTVFIRQGIVITESLKEEMIGKYLMTDYAQIDQKLLKQMWEDRVSYAYIVISEDETVGMYSYSIYSEEPITEAGTYTLEELLDDSAVRYENGKITVGSGNDMMLFEKTDEIPD